MFIDFESMIERIKYNREIRLINYEPKTTNKIIFKDIPLFHSQYHNFFI